MYIHACTALNHVYYNILNWVIAQTQLNHRYGKPPRDNGNISLIIVNGVRNDHYPDLADQK